jgi:hypothetical protein
VAKVAFTASERALHSCDRAWPVDNVGKRQEATTGGHGGDGHGTEGCCDANHPTRKPRSHDTSRIAWAKLLARQGEEFPLHCPNCGGDIRLIAFITEPTPIRKILTHLGERWGQCRYLRKSGQGVFQQPRPPLLSPSANQPFTPSTPDTPPDSRNRSTRAQTALDRTRHSRSPARPAPRPQECVSRSRALPRERTPR